MAEALSLSDLLVTYRLDLLIWKSSPSSFTSHRFGGSYIFRKAFSLQEVMPFATLPSLETALAFPSPLFRSGVKTFVHCLFLESGENGHLAEIFLSSLSISNLSFLPRTNSQTFTSLFPLSRNSSPPSSLCTQEHPPLFS